MMVKRQAIPYTDLISGEIRDALADMSVNCSTPIPNITAAQIEAWNKAPREEALREALNLYHEQGIDISEARFKLEVLKFITELQGAHTPQAVGGNNIIMIQVAQPEIKKVNVIETTEKKESD